MRLHHPHDQAHILEEEKLDPVLDMVLTFSITFAIATLSFYFYERPILQLKGRFIASVRPAPITPA